MIEGFRVERLEGNPIIHPGMAGLEGEVGENINGPSLIRVPDWVEGALGKYYLYFAHHQGQYIRLAYADRVEGPWTVYAPGVLGVEDGPGRAHIASPDVHVDEEARQIRMYFHQPATQKGQGQVSFVALSGDGLRFDVKPEVLGKFYLRMFRYGGWHYGVAKYDNIDGVLYRSEDGLSGFEEGRRFLPRVRHTAVWVEEDRLHLFYSKVGDCPEAILHATLDIRGDWKNWDIGQEHLLLAPEKDWEGGDRPLEPSRSGAVRGPVRQLRDPGVFVEDGRFYLLYGVAGEQGIGLARLHPQEA